MKIQKRIVLIVLISVTIYGFISLGMQFILLKPEVNEINNDAAQKDMVKTLQSIQNELVHLTIFTNDYAIWDDTYSFIETLNPKYIDNNIYPEALKNAGINFVAFFNSNHENVYGRYADVYGQWHELFPADYQKYQAFMEDSSNSHEGLISFKDETLLLSVQPILRTDGSGPPKGTIVFGKRIEMALSQELMKNLSLNFRLLDVDENNEEVAAILKKLRASDAEKLSYPGENKTIYRILSYDNDTMVGYAFLKDVLDQDILLIETSTDLNISSLVQNFKYYSVFSLSFCGIFISLMLIAYLRNHIVNPIRKLTEYIRNFDISKPIDSFDTPINERPDEIGVLAQNILVMEHAVVEKHREVKNLNEILDARVIERTLELEIANQSLILSDTILKESTEGVLIADSNLKILRVNDAFLKMTHYNQEDLLNKNMKFLQSSVHNESYYNQLWHEVETLRRWAGEFWPVCKDGTAIPNLLSINTIKDENGRISHYVGLFSDITHIKNTEKTLERLAYFDTLTELPNRELFYDRLNQAIKRTIRSNAISALLFIDLDRFKLVNDTLGHATGDEVLIEVARRLRTRVRNSDTVSRLGGDEFTIILENVIEIENAKFIADSLIDLISQPIETSDRTINISASIGIAFFPMDDTTIEGLMRKADTAMYIAKESGRSRSSFSSPEIERKNQETLELVEKLRQAVTDENFKLYLQPKVSFMDNEIYVTGAEALIRWINERGLVVPPDHFIALAEDTGLIYPIGRWVLEEACRQSNFLKDLDIHIPISINLSVKQLEEGNLVNEIADILRLYDVEPNQIHFELTENLFLKDLAQARSVLDGIKNLGSKIAIDDFGKGYSSMSYIGTLPVDYLKIDKSFIDPIGLPDEKELVSTIIAIAKTHHFKTVAEGVETDLQKDFLIAHDCDEMQGYLFSKPLVFEDFIEFLKRIKPR